MIRRALSEKIKQNIARVLDKEFALNLLSKKLPDYYPDIDHIKVIKLTPYKKHLGVTSAVFVVQYKITYIAKNRKQKNIDIFVSAHSDGSRKGAYEKNRFLYDHGFGAGQLRVTRPLFYSKDQYGYFYQSSRGRKLFSFFTENPQVDLKPVFALVAQWMKKLHAFDLQKKSFQWPNFSITTMIPEPERFIQDYYNDNEEVGKLADSLYQSMSKTEKANFKRIDKKLIYGDNHPENVIVENLQTDHLEMIDFTDIAKGDPMMDLGTFLQQFDFMGHNFISRERMNQYKVDFVESYFGQSFVDIDIDCINRINLYQSWTALRSSTFLFYMQDVDNPIVDLLEDANSFLKLIAKNERQINLY